MLGKLRLLFWTGIVLLLVPYIGVTEGVKTMLTIAIALIILITVFKLRRSYREMKFRLRRYEEPATTTDSIHA